jgi:hypothetical protein
VRPLDFAELSAAPDDVIPLAWRLAVEEQRRWLKWS